MTLIELCNCKTTLFVLSFTIVCDAISNVYCTWIVPITINCWGFLARWKVEYWIFVSLPANFIWQELIVGTTIVYIIMFSSMVFGFSSGTEWKEIRNNIEASTWKMLIAMLY